MTQIESLAFGNKHRVVSKSGLRFFFFFKMDKPEWLGLAIGKARALYECNVAERAEDPIEIILSPVGREILHPEHSRVGAH
jgi:hypothetical protein